MSTYIGFNTIDQVKKFTLTDFDLIKRDLLNAFNIRPGSLPGRPAYGSVIWNYLFEGQTTETQNEILAEVRRVVATDPRVTLDDLQVYPQENGILIELRVRVVPSKTSEQLLISFDQETRNATIV